ncbi:MAG: hypothetical protein AB7S38_40185 [Vulcanimicrobiota bacterium]
MSSYGEVADPIDEPAAGDASPAGWSLRGFDVAYPGGDFYSATNQLSSKTVDGDLILAPYRNLLNGWGLFTSIADARRFLIDFREEVETERASDFALWRLYHRPVPA